MTPLSPSTSPRLPSPPPFPEVQIGPRSPPINASANVTSPRLPNPTNCSPDLPETAKVDEGAARRIRPGTKAADMASGPPLVPLAEVGLTRAPYRLREEFTDHHQLDSPFQLQEHLKALYHHHTKSDQINTTMALSRETALTLANPPQGVDRSLWLYELCRLLVMKANNLIVAFFDEKPPCSAATCPEMRASEWQYLCAVHDPPKSCCAIDYCCHTLDWAANVLTSQKNFPSRLTLGSETTGGSQQGIRHLTNIFRRVYRIFAHAWFQHRQSFWEVEGKEGLYILFKTVSDAYNLIPEESYTISPEAEGIIAAPEEEKEGKSILKKKENEDTKSDDSDAPINIPLGATTKRHKHTPSTGLAVPPIAEGEEEEPKSDDSDASSITTSKRHKHTPSTIPAGPMIAEGDKDPETKRQAPSLNKIEDKPTPAEPAQEPPQPEISSPKPADEKGEEPKKPVEVSPTEDARDETPKLEISPPEQPAARVLEPEEAPNPGAA